jgi:hypothetical protein
VCLYYIVRYWHAQTQYITEREIKLQPKDKCAAPQQPAVVGTTNEPLSTEAKLLVQSSSSCLLSTVHMPDTVAVNHRGGSPGFVRVSLDSRTLYLPDYSGNR